VAAWARNQLALRNVEFETDVRASSHHPLYIIIIIIIIISPLVV